MSILKEVLPPEFVAVTLYVCCVAITDGVPLIIPVTVFKDSPKGKVGETE